MLQNAYFLAKIGADTAENEQHFAEILRKQFRKLPKFVKFVKFVKTSRMSAAAASAAAAA